MFGKKKGAPIGNHNAQGGHNGTHATGALIHNHTGLTDGRIVGTIAGAAGPAMSGIHGVVRGARGAKSRAGAAFAGGAIAGGIGSAIAASALGAGDDTLSAAALGGGLVGAINGGAHKLGHSLGKASYNNRINDGRKKRGL